MYDSHSSAVASHTPEDSFSLCEDLAKSHYENFSVVTWALPRDRRKHFYSIYAFCRSVDDLGDEHKGDRISALDHWAEDLERCYTGTPNSPYLLALQETIRVFDIPRDPFLKIIEANRMDQRVTRYATYKDVEFYCQHSANPVGHLVLYVSGYRDDERQSLSDFTCTALQLTNFWQDVVRDFNIGRVYIPQEDMRQFGYTEEQLACRTVTDSFRKLMAFEVERTRSIFDNGMPLIDTLEGNLKLDIALFTKGGLAVLDAIQNQHYDVLSNRPFLSKYSKLRIMLTTMLRIKLLNKP